MLIVQPLVGKSRSESITKEFAWSEMDVPLLNAEGYVRYKNIVHNWLAEEEPSQATDWPLQIQNVLIKHKCYIS